MSDPMTTPQGRVYHKVAEGGSDTLVSGWVHDTPKLNPTVELKILFDNGSAKANWSPEQAREIGLLLISAAGEVEAKTAELRRTRRAAGKRAG